MKPAIRVANLSKLYHLGPNQVGGYRTLREALVSAAAAPWHRLRSLLGRRLGADEPTADTHWALHDVSFEVQPGEVTGIIGHNGAGKSTLLKVLSRITEPSAGRVELRGRVASLLEVGTGFHQELTGRENIYLNGAILGMTRQEIQRKFDAIVDFSETGKFLDTPVKHYSSGMYMRLAFSVAAHLDPEILIVDEVLAVGDAQFQQKCLGKMGEVARGGRTILFVSHNMHAVQRLCRRAVLLERGRIVEHGDTEGVILRYLADGLGRLQPETWCDLAETSRNGNGQARFVGFSYRSPNTAAAYRPYPDGPLEITAVIESDSARPVNSIAVSLFDRGGMRLVHADTFSMERGQTLQKGRNEVTFHIEQLHLKPGVYLLGLRLGRRPGILFDSIDSAAEIEVIDNPLEEVPVRPPHDGIVTCPFTFQGAE